MQDIIETLHLSVSNKAVRRTVRKLGCRRKKKSLHASEQERPRCDAGTEDVARPYICVWAQYK